MEKRFKKIYIEITNRCNLNCSFCSDSVREKREMGLDKFEDILKKINDYTDYIYLHVKGEPLIHSNLDGILKLCEKYNKKVNMTTNGVLLKEKSSILLNNNVRQINISLHSENSKENYLDDILDTVSKLNCYIVFRFWALEGDISCKIEKMIRKIIAYYDLPENYYDKIIKENNVKVSDNVYINKDGKFIWPDVSNNYCNDNGYCLGLRKHIGILSDGTVTVCCLDGDGESNLGNIFDSNMEEILNSETVKKTLANFDNRKCFLEICKHCSYKDRFKKKK